MHSKRRYKICNTNRDISKLPEISRAVRRVKLRLTILKYHSWYLCQISLQIMLLPILILVYIPLWESILRNLAFRVFKKLFETLIYKSRKKTPLSRGYQ